MLYRLVRVILFLFPAETAHRLGMASLRALSAFPTLCRWLRRRATLAASRPGPSLEVHLGALTFPNPIGLGAGLDKDAEAVAGLFGLGFGFVEVGTLTPRPQPGNPRPRLWRIPEHRALLNRMGFNNHGALAAAQRLERLTFRPGPVGVNLGKNKDTPLETAAEDYCACVDSLAPRGDYVVINASSPNTPGLRALQEPEALAQLLRAVRTRLDTVAPGKPLFLKIAPDLTPEAVDAIVDLALAARVDGLIATNTTIARPFEHALAKEAGGLSGAPVRELANAVIRRAYLRSEGKLPIIGIGGVFTGADAYEKLRAGASLVQVMSGLVYAGPGMVRGMLDELSALLERDGFRAVSEIVGLDARSPAAGLSRSA